MNVTQTMGAWSVFTLGFFRVWDRCGPIEGARSQENGCWPGRNGVRRAA